MKKFLLFLLFAQAAFAQVTENVAIWNKFSPEYKNYIDAEDIKVVGFGSQDVSESWASGNGAYVITNLHRNMSGNDINYNKYIEFKIQSKHDKFIQLNHFSFFYIAGDNANQTVKKLQLRFSKNGFANNSTGDLLKDIDISNVNSFKEVVATFPTGSYIEENETVTVRMYLYGPTSSDYTKFYIARFIQDQHKSGPMVNATVSALSGNNNEVLVRYITKNRKPSILHPGITASKIQVDSLANNPITITPGNGWNAPYFHIKGWGSDNKDNNKYAQFVFGTINGSLKNAVLTIPYIVTNPEKLTVQYSKNFANGLIYENVYQLPHSNGAWKNLSVDLSKARAINDGEKLYVRFILTNINGTNSNGIFIKYKNDTQDGPYLQGSYEGTSAVSSCVVTTTWNGTKWDMGKPAFNKKAVINADFNMNDNASDLINACELVVAAGKRLTIGANQIFAVKNNITVLGDGKIVVQNDGSLVQINEAATYTGTPATFSLTRTTPKVHRYDYTYWSSPVVENANVFLLGKNPQNLAIAGLSPNTLASKYHSWDMATNNWINIPNGNAPMAAGKGYIVRAPSTAEYGIFPSLASSYNHFTANFVGQPNTGVINTPLMQDSWALVGNPYPSAINLDLFFDQNIDLIEGTVYIWTHDSPMTANQAQHTFNYSNTDYIAVNAIGTVSNKSRKNANNGEFIQLDIDNIAAGQSFFVRSKQVTSNSPKVTFKNNMRIRDLNQKAEFFAVGNQNESTDDWSNTGKHRIWLNISNQQNVRNEALIGYTKNATNGLDTRFDGEKFSGSIVSIYTIVEASELTIQGRALPFLDTDVVTVGFTTNAAGTFKIAVDEFDGLFTNQAIYLFDKALNTEFNLKNGSYEFQSEAGTFNDRFELRYIPTESLSVTQPVLTANEVIVYKTDNQIAVKVSSENIKEITVYDLQGKVLYSNSKVNNNTFVTNNLEVNNQVVLVKVTTENNLQKTQKLIM